MSTHMAMQMSCGLSCALEVQVQERYIMVQPSYPLRTPFPFHLATYKNMESHQEAALDPTQHKQCLKTSDRCLLEAGFIK